MKRVVIAIVFFATVAAAQIGKIESQIVRLGPKPPIERFPPNPYIPPPSPEEKEQLLAEGRAMGAASRRYRAAANTILGYTGIATGGMSRVEMAEARAATLEAAVEVLAAPAIRANLAAKAITRHNPKDPGEGIIGKKP